MAKYWEIPNNITLGASQSIRRNASDTEFEAFTPGSWWSWAVDSVNWQTWVVVLDTDDISEWTNKYVTSAEKTAITHSNRTALDNVSNTNSWDNATNTTYQPLIRKVKYWNF